MSHPIFAEPAFQLAPVKPDHTRVNALWARYRQGETHLAGDIIQLHLRQAATVAHCWSTRQTFPDTLSEALLSLTSAVHRAKGPDMVDVTCPTEYLNQSMRNGILKSRQKTALAEEMTVSLDECSPDLPDFAADEHEPANGKSSFADREYLRSIASNDLELSVLELKSEGWNNLEIADIIGISRKKVERAIKRVQGRLAVK